MTISVSFGADMKIYGIDVSSYQGTIDWSKVKAAGISFAILRVGTSKGKDSYFEKNYTNAKAVGMPLGVYYYSYASTVAKAQSEASTVVSWLSGKSFEYPIYFDIEDGSLLTGLTNTDRTNLCIAFNTVLENAGYYCGVYSGKYWLENYVNLSTLKAKYPIWMAQYLYSGTDSKDYSSSYPIWQYSSMGSVNGITGNVDMDVCYVDYPTLIKNSGKNGFSSTPACGYYKCTATSLNIRSGATTSNASIGTIPNDAEVCVMEFNSDYTWGNVIYNGMNGWSSMTYLTYVRPFTSLTVKYDAGGVDATVPETTTPGINSTITVSTSVPTSNGYEFLGWTLTRSADGKYYSTSSGWGATPSVIPAGAALTLDVTMFDSTLASETFTFGATWRKITSGWFTVATSSTSLNIRSGAGTSYSPVGSAPKGSSVAVFEFNSDNSWAKVNCNGTTGWCSADYLSYEKAFQSYVVAYDVAGKGTTSIASSTLKPYDTVTVSATVPKYDGYEFVAWNLKRASDGKYLSTDGTWESVASENSETFSAGDNITLNLSIIDKDSGSDAFMLVAIWNELPSVIYGDVDGDGGVTSKDLKLLKKYICGSVTEDEISEAASDVDGNGIITVQDAKYIKKYLSTTIDKFPVEE